MKNAVVVVTTTYMLEQDTRWIYCETMQEARMRARNLRKKYKNMKNITVVVEPYKEEI